MESHEQTPDPSLMLDIAERNALQHQGLEPNDYTAVTLGSGSVAVSNKLADGSFILQLQVRIPPGLFVEKPVSLIIPGGAPPNDLDGALGIPPSVRMVARLDRLTQPVRDKIQQTVEASIEPAVED